MLRRVLGIALLVLSACGPAEGDESDSFSAPEFVPVASCLTGSALEGSTEAQVQACAGDPCSSAIEHSDPKITTSWRLYCAEQQCTADCYWHVRVYFENGRVRYTRVRNPAK